MDSTFFFNQLQNLSTLNSHFCTLFSDILYIDIKDKVKQLLSNCSDRMKYTNGANKAETE